MNHPTKCMGSTGVLVLALAFTISTATPARAVVLSGNDCVDPGNQWSILECPDGILDPPISISGENHGFGQSASLDVVFGVDLEINGSGPIEFNVSATNLSKRAWKSYVFALGFGTGSDFTFATATGMGLLFDTSMPTTSNIFPNFVATSAAHPHELLFTDNGSVVNPGATVNFTFYVMVGDGAPTSFTLQQYANAVPEPATLALLGLGLAGLGWFRRKQE